MRKKNSLLFAIIWDGLTKSAKILHIKRPSPCCTCSEVDDIDDWKRA